MTGNCKHCGCQIHKDGSVWVDNSGGDVCGINGDNAPHVDILDDEYVIVSAVEQDSGAPLYWSNSAGWVGRVDATLFTESEKAIFNLPKDSSWELAG
jgi:hypothetical protein